MTLRPESPVIPVATLHAWRVRVLTASGESFVPSQLVVNGGMPGHGHGMPTTPAATRLMDSGEILIEGLRFHMAGEWQLVVGVVGPNGADRAVFDIEVRPPHVAAQAGERQWSAAERALIKSLWIGSLPDVALDASNRFSGRTDAAALGRALFMDTGLSAGGDVSCATCHDPARYFTDGRIKSVGSRETARHAPGLVGVAYGQWFYWDGRRDSLWAQALTPIETPGEMDSTRIDVLRYVLEQPRLGPEFLRLTGRSARTLLDDRVPAGAGPFAADAGRAAWRRLPRARQRAVNEAFADIGKIIAAFEQTLIPPPARFDRFAAALFDQGEGADAEFSASERRGLKLFLDESRSHCLRCHNGPLFTNHAFHSTGTALADDGSYDFGRSLGLRAALIDEFNCRGEYSDVAPDDCAELRFLAEGHLSQGAFKVPTLRNVAHTAPYMHDGRFADLRALLAFYRKPPDTQRVPHELPSLDLNDAEADDLIAFLKTL